MLERWALPTVVKACDVSLQKAALTALHCSLRVFVASDAQLLGEPLGLPAKDTSERHASWKIEMIIDQLVADRADTSAIKHRLWIGYE